MMNRKNVPDGRPTTAEWPVKIWELGEIPEMFQEQAGAWIGGEFSSYTVVYSPKRPTAEESYAYLFVYGEDKIFYLKEEILREKGHDKKSRIEKTELRRSQITEVSTKRELLNTEIVLSYLEGTKRKTLEFPYVPSVYYLYDPFLNWTMYLSPDFLPSLAEQEHPRPDKLYRESLAMFNFSLAAYRLGNYFGDYSYRFVWHRKKWMPWKRTMEEWLEVSMERGKFILHSFGYLTECKYYLTSGASSA